jgi:hypothetical protein
VSGSGGGGTKGSTTSLSSSQVQFCSSASGIVPEGHAGRRGSSLEIPRTETVRRRPSSIIVSELPRCGSNIWQPSSGRSSTHSQASFMAPGSPHSFDEGCELSPNGIKSGPLSMDPHSSFDQLRQSFHRPLVKSARRHSALMPTNHYDVESSSPSFSISFSYSRFGCSCWANTVLRRSVRECLLHQQFQIKHHI